jgi:hypothetical protein
MSNRQPIQPIVTDDKGVLRFKENVLVRYLLEHGGLNMNDLARVECADEDRQQFAQLIGYSIDGYSELSYVDDEAFSVACRMMVGASEQEARDDEMKERIEAAKDACRSLVRGLFGVDLDDVMEWP